MSDPPPRRPLRRRAPQTATCWGLPPRRGRSGVRTRPPAGGGVGAADASSDPGRGDASKSVLGRPRPASACSTGPDAPSSSPTDASWASTTSGTPPVPWCSISTASAALVCFATPDDHIAAELGIRLIAATVPASGCPPGRPGGDSWTGRADVEQFADRLGIDSFAVLGWSGGGPVCARLWLVAAGRVKRIGLISAAAPLTPGADYMLRRHRVASPGRGQCAVDDQARHVAMVPRPARGPGTPPGQGHRGHDRSRPAGAGGPPATAGDDRER